MQSGTAITKNQNILKPKQLLRDFLGQVGCEKYENRTTRRLMECMRSIDGKVIALSDGQNAYGALVAEPIPTNGDLTQVYLKDSPWNLMTAGDFNKNVPVIVGVNSFEQLGIESIFLLPDAVDIANKNFGELVTLQTGIPDDENHTVSRNFREVYFQNQPLSNETREGLINLSSDDVIHASWVSAVSLAELSTSPVYFYWFSKTPPRSYSQYLLDIFPDTTGASHADELQFLFQYDDFPEITLDSPWFPFSEKLVRLWVSFAATGRPISPTTEWSPLLPEDENGLKWFQIDDELQHIEPKHDRMDLWDNYIAELYEIK